MWFFPRFSKTIDPYLTILNALPKVALGPLIIIWVGASTNSIILKLSERISTLGREYDLGLKINIIISEDIIQLLFDYSNKHKLDLLTIVNETWEQVKLRDWKKYPKDDATTTTNRTCHDVVTVSCFVGQVTRRNSTRASFSKRTKPLP